MIGGEKFGKLPIMKRFSKMLAVALALVLIAGLAGCGGEKAAEGVDAGPAPLIVGMELAYPPFEMRDTNNQPDRPGMIMLAIAATPHSIR